MGWTQILKEKTAMAITSRIGNYLERYPVMLQDKISEFGVTRKYDIGVLYKIADGREYAYGKFGGAITAGDGIVGNPWAFAGAITVTEPKTATFVATVALGVDTLQWGYIELNKVVYKISGNTGGDVGATITVKLFDEIYSAKIGDVVTGNIAANPYSFITTAGENPKIGVALNTVTADTYGWVQIKGIGYNGTGIGEIG